MTIKEVEAPANNYIAILTRYNTTILEFRMTMRTPLGKLMQAYCNKTKTLKKSLRFTLYGQPVNEDDTPNSLEMKEDDVIDVHDLQA